MIGPPLRKLSMRKLPPVVFTSTAGEAVVAGDEVSVAGTLSPGAGEAPTGPAGEVPAAGAGDMPAAGGGGICAAGFGGAAVAGAFGGSGAGVF